jgi:hypothetical protein
MMAMQMQHSMPQWQQQQVDGSRRVMRRCCSDAAVRAGYSGQRQQQLLPTPRIRSHSNSSLSMHGLPANIALA